MALLVFSSRLATSLNFAGTTAAVKHKPSRDWISLGAQTSVSTSSRVFQVIGSQVLPSSTSPGKSIALQTAFEVSTRAGWKPPNYVYPDPNLEFAKAETKRFQVELMRRLSENKETFGNDIEEVVSVCSEIFSNFLHKEYGGPGTLLVEPFTDMLLALRDRKLRGPPVAARAALLWAQNYVDRDWEIWMSQTSQ